MDTIFNTQDDIVREGDTFYRFQRQGAHDTKVFERTIDDVAWFYNGQVTYNGPSFRPRLQTLWEMFQGLRDMNGQKVKV